MNKKKKIIIIIIIVAIILSILICASVTAFAYIINSAYKQAEEIKENTIIDVCESHGDFSQTEYKAWFASSYRDSQSLEDAKEIVGDAFPSDFQCDNLPKKNIFEFYNSSHSINSSIIMAYRELRLHYQKVKINI